MGWPPTAKSRSPAQGPSPSLWIPKSCASNPRSPPWGRAMPRPYKNNSGARMPNRYYEKDGNLDYLAGRTVAIISYGSQGHAHRSEEHTSELQSLRHLVCRLLLEKK